ncbi:DegT/DnrJ/EryC1/StrS family aminotransferase [Microtetraspora sp. NBRC 16547]|uniref:DegT/DnrJ/EryC1/StrS family aminotransferase n=1 Tax=Microtetraspora sp. NBRC 16547 TaxID=3030993 RepID=UPI0024A3C298|nr:DegT/DnrJ/EryC1/StrS family aminotransferase [Microtetraspora sp. NBRC 16547]GLW99717.1 hypothetical protein Misp02_38040 [Microtetraspora sp. NBRC 16547]
MSLEEILGEEIGRPGVHVPSARFGLYLALRCLVKPGGRVLMSPVNTGLVAFAAMAAGLRPVMAPASLADGNIDVETVTLDGVDAVLTTNHLGVPDRVAELRERCDQAGIPLIEDCAHALQTTVGGRRVGTFGDAGVHTLSKHAAGHAGGFVTGLDPDAVRQARDEILRPGRATRDVANILYAVAVNARRRPALARVMLAAMGLLGRSGTPAYDPEPYRAKVRAALEAGGDLDAFRLLLGVAQRDFDRAQGALHRRYLRRRLAAVTAQRAERVAGVARLAALPQAAPGARAHADQPLIRVPLLVEERDRVVAELQRHGLVTHYLYLPPLGDLLGPELVDQGEAPEAARRWAAHVLPVDPLRAGLAVRLLERIAPAPAQNP